MLNWIIFFLAIRYSLCVNNKTFPADFMFGLTTSAYQIEGGWNLDGKSESCWDNFTHMDSSPIYDGSNGDIAADSYHLYKKDVTLLQNIGVSHYRFSISWSRILPEGFGGEINQLGVDYYKNLITLLKQNEIEPVVTLFYWDLPQVLQDQGGFLNESAKDWFAAYAKVCFNLFGNSVKLWSTFNQPAYFCHYGYGFGIIAPGLFSPAQADHVCLHNVIKAHAAAWHVYDEQFRQHQRGKISINAGSNWFAPATDNREDIDAAERAMLFSIGIQIDPLYFGDYPEIVKSRIAYRSQLEGFYQSRLPDFSQDEKEYLTGTLDYFSLNTYESELVYDLQEADISAPSIIYDMKIGYMNSNRPDGGWGIAELLK